MLNWKAHMSNSYLKINWLWHGLYQISWPKFEYSSMTFQQLMPLHVVLSMTSKMENRQITMIMLSIYLQNNYAFLIPWVAISLYEWRIYFIWEILVNSILHNTYCKITTCFLYIVLKPRTLEIVKFSDHWWLFKDLTLNSMTSHDCTQFSIAFQDPSTL